MPKARSSRAQDAGVGYDPSSQIYKVDQTYRDTTDASRNQFHRWLGVKNSGGIRPLLRADKSGLAALVLVSSHISVATYNPWEDVLDPLQGRIWYWGDAKAHPTKTRDDWTGNRYLQRVWCAINERSWADVPPLLHFSKPAKGQVTFNGVCVLADLADAWMEEKRQRVRNYMAKLDVLPIEVCPVAWIRARVAGTDAFAPPEWVRYAQTGQHGRLVTWAKQVRTKGEQLPPEGSAERRLLHTLNEIDPFKFERLVVRAFDQLDVSHQILGTRRSRDGGFDFHGSFRLPPPLSYSVALKGEVKRYNPESNTVGVKDVARLVARLQRGEHGIFVTNSSFSTQAQEEVFADRYPVELLHGGRLTSLLGHCGATRNGELDPAWLSE